VKLLTTVAAALLLCFTGAFTYIWYQTNNTVDQAIKAIAPYAHISYGSIITSVYPGKLGLADVTILLEGKRLYAEAITVSAPSILDLYALQKNPYLFLVKHPRLEIRGLRSPVPAHQFTLLAQPFNHPYLKTLTNLDAVACGNRDAISFQDLETMGYATPITDIELWSGPQPFGESYAFELSANIRGIRDYTMKVNFVDAPSSVGLALHRLEQLDIDNMVLQTRDHGYNPRRIEFCAEQLGMTVESYQRHHLAAVRQHLAKRSIIVDQDMLKAYGEGLHRGARMALKIQPQADFSLDDLGFYQAGDYLELLGVAFSVNNRSVNKTKTTQVVAAEPDTSDMPATIDSESPVSASNGELEWPELQQAIHQDIVVFTESGGKHYGRLELVQQNLLVLKKRFGADSMTYTIERRRFNHAEIIN
jgi:hypothetical protein